MTSPRTQVKHHPGRLPYHVGLVEDGEGFAALEGEWEELYRHCPTATPFQSWAWLYSWWEHYGEGYRLRLVTVRSEGGSLVGVLPLMVERGPLRRLLLVGSGVSDYLDVLVREGWEERVAQAASRALGEVGPWRVADLQELRPGAAAWGVFGGWAGPRAVVWQSNCPVIEVRPWEELLASVKRGLRKSARRTERRAQEDGLRCRLVDVEESEEAGRRLVALNRIAWQGRAIGPEHLTRRFEDHIATAARRMTASGHGGISELEFGEESQMYTFMVFGRDFLGSYMSGVPTEIIERYQWSSLYIWDGLNIAESKDIGHLDLLRGEEEYKLLWTSEVVANRRLILGRGPLFWAPYAGYHAARFRIRDYLYSESSPRWIKDAADRYRALRRRWRAGA